MKLKILTAGLCLLLFFNVAVMAQVNRSRLLYYHIGEKDGLADNLVTCFYQDDQGIMWLGTQYGLNSFDGSVIRTWQYAAGSGNNSIASNHINAITGDRHRTLWLATDDGLSSLNLNTKKIHTWRCKGSNYMRGLAIDGRMIWIAAADGLLAFDTTKKIFQHFKNEADIIQPHLPRLDNDCRALLLDVKKRLWVATVNGLWLFDINKQTYMQYDGPVNDPFFDGLINTIFQDHAGNIWAGAWSKGLKQIDPARRSVQSFNTIKDMPGHIMSIAEQKNTDGSYKLWLSGALTSFDPKTTAFTPHALKPIAEAAPLDPRCLFVSSDNLLWVSTTKGVYIIDPERQIFEHTFITSQTIITSQSAAIFDRGHRLWVGGDKDLVFKLYDDHMNVSKDYMPAIRRLKGQHQKFDIAVMNATPYQNDELWLSTTAGVLKLDIKTNKVSVVCDKFADDVKFHPNFINNVYINNNVIWCFPWRNGVWQYDAGSKKFNPLVIALPENKTPKYLNLNSAVSDDNGNVWLSDLDYGVVKYTRATNTFSRFVNKDIPPFTRTSNIKKIGDRIWLLSNTTVVAIDPKTNRTQSWPLPNSMNKYVYDYTNDNKGNLWIAAKTGLVVFNTQNYSFNQYTEDDGLINNNMDGTLHLMESGKIIYAGENYITSFNPVNLLRVPAKKTLLLSAVSADEAELPVHEGQPIVVPPGSSKVGFKWTLINYTNPLQNHYYGRLEGIDKGWNDAGNKGHIEYNNLAPGTYKFHYKAVTADGLAREEKTLLFMVKPSFWQTWLFQFFLLALLIVLIFFIIRHVRLTEQRKAALQLQLSELKMKALRAQMNPHFIFNALNSIQECIITQKTDAAYTYLSSFSKLVRLILENSEKQFITLADEIETLRLYLSVEKLRFDDTFEYLVDVAPDIDTSFVCIPSMIIQPFVENALWHGLIHKKGSKLLTINFKQENAHLLCKVSDNGIGRQHAELLKQGSIKKQSLGMKITTDRLVLLEAGTVITVNDLKDASGGSAGTEVTFVIPLKH